MRQRKRHVRRSQVGDRLHSSGRRARGRARIKRTRFIKSDIPKDPHPTGNRVVVTSTLVLRTVPKENIHN